MSAPKGPEQSQIRPTVMGAPVAGGAEEAVEDWLFDELDAVVELEELLLLDEQAATAATTATTPARRVSLELVFTCVDASS